MQRILEMTIKLFNKEEKELKKYVHTTTLLRSYE